jgi:transcriptional regulator with XRE-family HTH domain
MSIGEELKNQRLANGLTLLELEKKTGISNQNLSRWERGLVIPNVEFCIKLADFYGITLDELVGRDLKI